MPEMIPAKYLMPKLASQRPENVSPAVWQVVTRKPTEDEKQKRLNKLIAATAIAGGLGFAGGKILSRVIRGTKYSPTELKRLRRAVVLLGLLGSPPATYMIGRKAYVAHPTSELRAVTHGRESVQPGDRGLDAGLYPHPSKVPSGLVFPARSPGLPLGALPRGYRDRNTSDTDGRYKYVGTPARHPGSS